MAIAKMQKISIITHAEKTNEVIKLLQNLSIVQIINPQKDELQELLGSNTYFEKKEDLEFDIANLKYAIDFLSRYDLRHKPSMIQSFMGDLPSITISEFQKNIGCDYKNIISQIGNIDSKMQDINRDIKKIESDLAILRSWSLLSINPSDLKKIKNYLSLIGSIKKSDWDTFTLKLSKITKLIYIIKISNSIPNQKDQKFVLIYPNNLKISSSINALFSELSINESELIKNLLTDVNTSIKNNLTLRQKLLDEIQTYKNQILDLVPEKTKLMCIYESMIWQDDLKTHKELSLKTKSTNIIYGWVKVKDLHILEKNIQNITNCYEIIKLDNNPDEEPPVSLENSRLIKPFEAVTNIYGMPKYTEPDPTTWLAPFFIIFFALCLTDAGYGIFIVIITYIMLKKWDFILIRLLNYAGWATIVIGALTGGWFGIDLSTMQGTPLGDTLIVIRVFDPIKDPIIMMLIALALGIIQIWTGIACKMYWNIKNKKISDAFLDQLPWLYFLIAVIGFALSKSNVLSNPELWQTLLIIGVITIIITQSRSQKNFLLKPFSGTLKLYDAIGYLSDTLSYARLLALGLATAIIAFVINIIASLTKGIPYIGIFLFIIILIGGHTFNLAINLLGSFIHSARLQYVEFFSKFMEGGGTKFKPFSKKNTYLNILNK